MKTLSKTLIGLTLAALAGTALAATQANPATPAKPAAAATPATAATPAKSPMKAKKHDDKAASAAPAKK